MIEMVTNDAIIKAAKRLKGKIVRTPLLKSDHVNKELKSNIYIKAENLQTIGAFKFRGAMNTILQLPPDVKKVVAWSSGNHAQAVAAAANITEREATIVMPKDSPKTKLNGTIAWGAKIVEYDRNTENREEIGKAIAKEQNAIIIPPFDDVNVIIGQGTAGLEAVEQLKEINVIPDIVLCCCGGGGLIAGVSTSIKANYPNAQIYSVEPENFDDTKKSLEADMIVENTMQHLSICDALLANKPGNITFEINRKNLSGGISVSDTESLIAMKIAYKYFKIVLEPGGAVALAAAISKKIDIKNKNVLVIASGGNVDSHIFEKCLYAESF
ncbi:threonine/serine dehydratase [Alphaproteobacteria bacterium]|jgi:threonine dehydratase|nr:threonine/serine dehydratase [Alphaproteobacteria bacterium]|tara:strand:- start:45 stop:1025 length:981 start_codon:yes stop_codon:yes gene_type:complete